MEGLQSRSVDQLFMRAVCRIFAAAGKENRPLGAYARFPVMQRTDCP
jgi:hypothetical protein